MSEIRMIMDKLRAAFDEGDVPYMQIYQRGNYTMVRIAYKIAGREYEGIGFAKRDPTRYPAPEFRFDCYVPKGAWRQDKLDTARGREIALGRAIRDLAEQIVKREEEDGDVPF